MSSTNLLKKKKAICNKNNNWEIADLIYFSNFNVLSCYPMKKNILQVNFQVLNKWSEKQTI